MTLTLENRISNKEYASKISVPEFLFIIFYIIYSILPAMPTKISFIYITMLATVYSIYIALTDDKLRNVIVTYLILIFIMSFAYYLLVDTAGVSVYASNYQFKKFMAKYNQYFSLFFPALLGARLIKYGSFRQKNITLITAYISMGYIVLKTTIELMIDPNIAKQFGNIDETAVDNIANYYYVYAVPLILSLITMYFFYTEKKIFRVLLIATIVFLLFFLLKTQYILAFLIGATGIYFAFFKKFKSTSTKAIILLLTFILMFLFPFVLKIIADNVESEQSAIRLTELYNFLVLGDSSGYNLSTRLTLYWRCIEAFFKSPFIGNRSLDFNGHSTILSVPADLGFLGLFPFYYMFFKMNTHIKTLLEKDGGLFTPIFLILFMMGMTNPIHSSTAIAVVAWLVSPLAINILFYNKSRD